MVFIFFAKKITRAINQTINRIHCFFFFFSRPLFIMELDPITADFPSRTAREEEEEAAEALGPVPEPVAIVSYVLFFLSGLMPSI